MSNDYKIKKNTGLYLAHLHKSARSQVDPSRVYKKLEKASEVHLSNAPQSLVTSRASSAIRLGLDRLSRLGERIREDTNVSKKDMRLMKEEAEYLSRTIERLYKGKMNSSSIADQTRQLDLSGTPEQFSRIVSEIYKGGIKIADQVDELGGLVSQDKLNEVISFKGDYSLKDKIAEIAPMTAQDLLSYKDNYAGQIITKPIGGLVEGPQYIEHAIDRVRGEVLKDPKTLLNAQGSIGDFKDFDLLFS